MIEITGSSDLDSNFVTHDSDSNSEPDTELGVKIMTSGISGVWGLEYESSC